MASKTFKTEITQRFADIVKHLMIIKTVRSKTEIGLLIDLPLQVVSKPLTVQRIITLEQTQKLILDTNIYSNWFIMGENLILMDQSSSIKESKMAYYISGTVIEEL